MSKLGLLVLLSRSLAQTSTLMSVCDMYGPSCMQLPNYRRASTMKTKLLYAVSSGAGFELS